MGNFTNDLVFLSNAGGAPSNGLVERMRIAASGNVGIGTMSPTSTLAVAAAPFELNDYPVVGIQGLAAAYGGKQNGRIALVADGGDGDPAQSTSTGGIGGWFTGGERNQTGGIAGLFYGGDAFLEEGGSAGIWSSGGFGGTGNNLVQAPAALFFGSVEITGELTASSKSFKIDHPLDPANKYLVHSSVESDERLTVYSGNVTTNARGEARVQFPGWFEVLNTDFRYHLTVIGQFAQAIVSNKISDNQFSIQTDKPNVEVSWQVTGVRQDAYAKANPLDVERQKDARERGHYMYPRLHDAPENRSVSWARYPEVMKTIEDARARKLAGVQRWPEKY